MRAKFVSRGIALLIATVALFVSAGCESHPTQRSNETPYLNNVDLAGSSSLPQLQQSLGLFYRDLGRLQAGQIPRLNILQLGDSHTAADFFSGRLREKFQQQFGDAGRGMMPPGVAFNGIDQRQMKFTQSEGWLVENSLKSPNSGPYGISGFVTHSLQAGAHMALAANATDSFFDWASVEYLKHPGGGKFQVFADGTLVGTVSTAGPEGQVGYFLVRDHGRMGTLGVLARSAGIDFTAWSVGRNDRGIVLSSHGVVGATVDLFNRWNPAIVASDIASLRPSLVIVAYGTNEAFDSDFKAALYAQNFAHVLASIRHAAPNAAILVVGPPDSQRGGPNWEHPPALEIVREIQRQEATAAGAAFWDWSGVMPDGMSSWVDRGLARPDHVHFTPSGYEAAADQLFEWLMQGYAQSRQHIPIQPRRN
jgi:lysophospholipase L1-like esterase